MKRILLILIWIGCEGIYAQQQPVEPVFDSIQYQNRGTVVLGKDTLFFLYNDINGITARERAGLVSQRLQSLLESESFAPDSFYVEGRENYSQIRYKKQLIANITDEDARWYGEPHAQAAKDYRDKISRLCSEKRDNIDLKEILKEIGLAIVVLILSALVIRYVNRLFGFFANKVQQKSSGWAAGIKIKNYELLDVPRMVSVMLIGLNIFRIIFLLFIFYLTLPLVLKIFPWTEEIADMLFGFILNPLKGILMAIIGYLPNLFTIIIIFIVIRYITKGVSFLANEVRTEKLKITGFFPDWAKPTSRIINFILYVFMLVLIWPYIPGSDSAIFKGVSVFLGLLISLGSSSAISNIVSGLVITYMRPFKVGDRVKIGEVSGDVMEKNLLVTRVRTIKNEIITVPNSSILTSSSINYSISSEMSEGLILHTSVTIGYDTAWRKVHEMLINAALKTPLVSQNPAPFVLQTRLDDFYISYQINAYTRDPQKQAMIYSDLHALIQDEFAKNGVEIMSPHYRANREGKNTVPPVNGKNESTDS